ncbi:aminopeptidase N-like isoform X2 [Galleria mellonella]|uniref:Aminopeptidase N-like isoform X2 n=1 Tax=Galleria mellonella TaxID=7137 RepID=A0A6J1WTY7_GALME|nr:aminopeptidase N-like isoform X2 [Galleria mellonella]
MNLLTVITVFSLIVFSGTIPISIKNHDTFKKSNVINDLKANEGFNKANSEDINENIIINDSNILGINTIRPGMSVTNYAIAIEPDLDSGTFDGVAIIDIIITEASTRGEDVILYSTDLDIHSVKFVVGSGNNFQNAEFKVNDEAGRLEISTHDDVTLYRFMIEYTGNMNVGWGLFTGRYDEDTYIAMNLHPTHARRVFPCMDELTQASNTRISFTFNGLDAYTIVTNSKTQGNSNNEFTALPGPPYLWGMLAHNLENIVVPTPNVLLYGRPTLQGIQDSQASLAINSYFNFLNAWTDKDYFSIVTDQDGKMHIYVLPDLSREWHSLSVIGLWEGDVFMERSHSIKQRKVALVKIAEAMARQWFGYVIYPENWRYQWVISGLASYAAWDAIREFQHNPVSNDITMLDVDTLFVTEVIQESLLLDGYAGAQLLEPNDDIFDEDEVRYHVNGLLRLKAPAILRMLRFILGDEEHDFIKTAAQTLLYRRALDTINSHIFYDSIKSDWMHSGTDLINNLEDYLETWVHNTGYPVIFVSARPGGVLLTQERFGFTSVPEVNYKIPLTFTTSLDPNFDDEHIYPIEMMDQTKALDITLNSDSWILFNIQGQGYYRVNYADDLWENIIDALDDPDSREEIHPLNRATLVDDSLNLARAGKLKYDIAFEVVATMEHEKEYAVWKAFIRNMDFIRKRLEALVSSEDNLDPDIYIKMVRRVISRVEDEIGFDPDPRVSEAAMVTMTRGLVMEHACKSNYNPCVAAAVDWFYDSDSDEPTVNPDIPHEIRPAVYCTMVREGDDVVIDALYDRLEIEPTMYERIVILESLACSQNENFITSLLYDTIADDSPYNLEERNKIFAAVASSSFNNAFIAMHFMAERTIEIRNMYGGPEKLEELIFILADNMADEGQSADFQIWVNSLSSNLQDSEMAAKKAVERVTTHLVWNRAHLEDVYDWIAENNSPALTTSIILLLITVFVTLFN